MKKRRVISLLLITLISFNYSFGQTENQPKDQSQTHAKKLETEEERIVRLLLAVLQDLPVRIVTLKPAIKRIAFYSFRIDRPDISPTFKKVLQNTVENELMKIQQIQLVNIPELKPIRVIVREDSFRLTNGLQSFEDMKKLNTETNLEGLLEGDLFLSGDNLYLNLKITDTATGEVVWTGDLFSKEFIAPQASKEYAPTVDIGLGVSWLKTDELTRAITNPPVVSSSAAYYVGELRILEPAWPAKIMDFSLKGGAMMLASGASFTGGAFVATGLRLGIIPKRATQLEAGPFERQYWLCLSLDFGRIFPTGESGITTVSGQLEMDISKHFSIAAGISYTSTIDITYQGSTIRVGGTSYDFIALRFYFSR